MLALATPSATTRLTKEAHMRYMIALLLLALALPVFAQTAEIEALEAEVKVLNHEIQKARAAHHFKSLGLDRVVLDKGFYILADTLDQGYVVMVIPDSLVRDTRAILRSTGERGLPFIKTANPRVIRMGRLTLPLADKAIKKFIEEEL